MKTASGDGGMRMQLRAALVLACGLAAASAWSGAGREQERRSWPQLPFVSTSGSPPALYRGHSTLVLGNSLVEFGPETASAARDWGSVVVLDVGANSYDPREAEPAVMGLLSAHEGWTYELDRSSIDLGITGGNERRGADSALREARFWNPVNKGAAGLTVRRYGQPAEYRVLMWMPGGANYAVTRLETTGEFFPGEAELLATAIEPDYEPKAVALLYNAFPTDAQAGRDAFRQAAVFSMEDILEEKQPSLAGAVGEGWARFAAADEQRKILNAVLQGHLKFHREPAEVAGVGKVDAPVLEWPPGAFEAVYGESRPAYTTVWLRYCYERGRPLLAGVTHQTTGLEDYTYNWQQYRKVSLDEGTELARLALRYLTWGMDYVLPAGGPSDRPSFSAGVIGAGDLGQVRTWVLDRDGPMTDGLSAEPHGVGEQTSLETGRYAPRVPPEAGDAAVDAEALGAVRGLLTSPFSGVGNPVAWVPGGVDTPRLFNYKVMERRRADAWLQTLSRGQRRTKSNYFDGKVMGAVSPGSEGSLGNHPYEYESSDEVVKAYQAGVGALGVAERQVGQPGKNSPDKSAGVDAAGLLSGVLAMSSLHDQVLSFGNEAVATRLRDCASMPKPEPEGDLNTGRPNFAAVAADGSDGVRGGRYRFTRADIERMTVLVPDLSLVQIGDGVLGAGTGDTYELGIVVGMTAGVAGRDTEGYDPRVERSKIVVVGVNRVVGHVFVSRWEAGYLTGDPDGFQVRRLLRRVDGKPLTRLSDEEYDPLTADGKAMVMDVTYAQSTFALSAPDRPRGENHWIPNTGEVLGVDSIRVRRAGEPFLSEKDPQVQVLGMVDVGAEGHDQPADGSNKWWNQGGGFHLVAVVGDVQVTLGSFDRRNGQTTYELTGTGGGLAQDGWPGRTGGLYLRGGKVTYQGPLGTTSSFGLMTAGSARPGDDVLLRFAVRASAETTAMEVSASPWDFAAVYDKKLLWRANLYVDEGGDADWNNRNPWVGAENDWYVSRADGAYVDGGQVAILPTTRAFPGALDATRRNSVGYGWGGWDTVPEYNSKLAVQAQLIADAREQTQAPGDLYLGAAFAALDWAPGSDATLAPGGDWHNYVFPGRRYGYHPNPKDHAPFHFYDYSAEEDNFPVMPAGFQAQHTYRVSGRKVYVPELSSFMAFKENHPLNLDLPDRDPDVKYRGYEYGQTLITAGADCSGFVSQAANYLGNRYLVSGKDGVGALVQESWAIAPGANNARELQGDLDRLVPGDVLAVGHHIVIVLDVTRDIDGWTDREDIRLIHEGAGPNWENQVLAGATWNADAGIGDDYYNYAGARLKI